MNLARKDIMRISRALCLLLVASSAAGCSRETEQASPVIRPVRYQQVFASGGERTRSFSGVTRAGVESRLSFKVSGTVERVAVEVGDAVSAGDLIARVDPKDYRLQEEEAQASLRRQEAQERNASAAYDRTRSLYENGHASLNDLDAARASFETARAAVRAAEKALELARSQLGYTTLSAPVDGSIASVSVEVNENVQPGQVVAVLTSGSQPEMEVSVPEVLIGDIHAGDAVTVTCDAIPGERFEATVTEVGVAAMGMATTFPVVVRLDEPNPAVRPGMAGEVVFSFASEGGVSRIYAPPPAVGEDRESRFVFVVEDVTEGVGVAKRRTVTVGELTSDGLEIAEGLRDGDLLVTAGVTKLVDGQQVRLLARSGGSGS